MLTTLQRAYYQVILSLDFLLSNTRLNSEPSTFISSKWLLHLVCCRVWRSQTLRRANHAKYGCLWFLRMTGRERFILATCVIRVLHISVHLIFLAAEFSASWSLPHIYTLNLMKGMVSVDQALAPLPLRIRRSLWSFRVDKPA